MAKCLGLIHTVPPLIQVFDRLAAETLPGVRLLHILDEPLLEAIARRGALAPADTVRLRSHVEQMEAAGADAVLVTCSTISPGVDLVRQQVRIPVLRIDEAMIAEAVARGPRIGVIATNETTLEPTRQALQAEADRLGREIEVKLVPVAGALPALLSGDAARHDRLVAAAVHAAATQCDVLVLAQASMARVLATLPESACPAPILSSPHLALAQVRRTLGLQHETGTG
jgi:Asp/Glu/hydantoin racemase